MDYTKLPKIVIDGTREQAGRYERFTVFVAGRKLLLQGRQFRALTLLALAIARKVNGGWVHGLDLCGGNQQQAIYLLRKDIREAAAKDHWLAEWAQQCIEGDMRGWYRLNARRDRIVIDADLVERFHDADIERMMTKS